MKGEGSRGRGGGGGGGDWFKMGKSLRAILKAGQPFDSDGSVQKVESVYVPGLTWAGCAQEGQASGNCANSQRVICKRHSRCRTSPCCHPGQAVQEYHHLREIGINVCQAEVGRKENT